MDFAFDIDFVRNIERSTAELGRNCALAMRPMLPHLGIETLQAAGGIAVFAGVGSPITQASGIGLDGPVAADQLETLERFFFDRGAPADFELTPYIDSSVLEWVRGRPYRLQEFSEVLALDLGLALDLDQDRRVSLQANHEVEVRIVKPEDYKLFIHTVAHGYTHGVEVPADELLMFEGFARTPMVLSFLASIGGEPAGGATLTIQNEIAGFHGGSTLPAFRSRGVQTALIVARFAEARRRACKLAVTVTHPTGSSRRNMARFGFVPAYLRVKMSRSRDR